MEKPAVQSASRSSLRIGILCPPAGNGNLGDEATVMAVIQSFKARYPEAQLLCFSSNPADTARRHGTTSLPASRMARGREPLVVTALPARALRDLGTDGGPRADGRGAQAAGREPRATGEAPQAACHGAQAAFAGPPENGRGADAAAGGIVVQAEAAHADHGGATILDGGSRGAGPVGQAIPGRPDATGGVPLPAGEAARNAGGDAPAAPSMAGSGTLKAWLGKLPFLRGAVRCCRNSTRALREVLGEIPFLAHVIQQSRRLDLLVVAGSGQLCDHFGGPWNFPYTIFKWCLAARCSGARVAFLSSGAGPLAAPLSRFFVKRALSLASYKSFRDSTSRALVEDLGVSLETAVHPDLVYNIRLPPRVPVEKPGGITVGINPFPHFDSRYWPEGDQAAYESYVSIMASFAAWLMDQGHSIFFFPTQVRADPHVIADIEERLRACRPGLVEDRLLRARVSDLGELVSQMAIADFILATRFHALVFAFLLDKPVLAIANHHKMSDLMSSMGQMDYLLDVRALDLEMLIERFQALQANVGEARSRASRAVSESSLLLERQYDEVLRWKAS